MLSVLNRVDLLILPKKERNLWIESKISSIGNVNSFGLGWRIAINV
jgi:hypothetical protein